MILPALSSTVTVTGTGLAKSLTPSMAALTMRSAASKVNVGGRKETRRDGDDDDRNNLNEDANILLLKGPNHTRMIRY